jgi:hypothetical protein
MATETATITKAWDDVVDAGDEFLLSTLDAVIEIATTDAGEPEIAAGHVLSPYERESASRALVGPGIVWVRISPSHGTDSARLAVTTWSA